MFKLQFYVFSENPFLLPEQRFFCIMAVMEGRCLLQIFNTPGILKLELSGQVILDFLLDHFVPAVLYYDSAYCTDGQAPSKADKSFSPFSPAITSRITKTPEPARNLLTYTSGC